MNGWEGWRERIRNIRADGMTRWWWWWWNKALTVMTQNKGVSIPIKSLWLLITLQKIIMVFFLVQIWKLYTIKKLFIFYHIALDKRRKKRRHLVLEIKSFNIVQENFRRKFDFNCSPKKSKMYRGIHTFQATESIKNITKKAEKSRFGRKLTTRCPNNVDVV